MPSYRCYFLNLQSAVAHLEIVEADSDANALARAAALFQEKGAGFSAFELWERGRRIRRDPAPVGVP